MQTSAYWNTWFEYQGEPVPAALTVGNNYSFVIDLSPYEYAKLRARDSTAVGSSNVDPHFKERISLLLLAPKQRELTLQIRPLIAEGSGLKFTKPVDLAPLKADLQRLRQPNTTEAQRYIAGLRRCPSSRNGWR